MKDGFIRVAAATPDLKVADPVFNREQTWKMMQEAADQDVKILVFPELGLTGYTCGDLFLQDTLIDQAKEELLWLLNASKAMDMLTFIGLPWMKDGKLYNVAAVIKSGELLGLVPKRHLPNYSEFYELRHFNPGPVKPDVIEWGERLVPFGSKVLFRCTNIPELVVAAELCEDVWTMDPPSVSHAKAGATVIANCSASDETTGKAGYRETLIAGQSARLVCAYIYANAGEGESTQDLVFGGHDIIAENGNILAESERFKNGMITADIDLYRLKNERRRMTTCQPGAETEDYDYMDFTLNKTELTLKRYVDPAPFVPSNEKERTARCEEILTIQAMGLKKRLAHTGAKSAVVGISGGLDSTLALLITARAFDMLGISRENILSVTMPCFGTTDRTYNNAVTLTKKLGATLREVNIRKAVSTHFEDIGHDPAIHDVTYENSQARYRTLILMDLANKTNGMVIGTALADVLYDVLDTPVSPELLPPEDGKISQKTEDLVGPYELHDFFLYYILRYGYHPAKIYRLAKIAFAGVYEDKVIYKWLNTFYRRFFAQQFKRSCLPDGPKVGSVAVSPRGDLRMPSDAARRIWMDEVEKLDPEADR